MIIPGLILAEQDRDRGELDAPRAAYIFQSVRELLEDLAERPVMAVPAAVLEATAVVTERAAIGVEAAAPPASLAEIPSAKRLTVLGVPANDEADELAALMLAHVLRERGIQMEVLSCQTLAGERLEVVQAQGAGLVCVSAVPPQALLHARSTCKRLRARYPDLKVVAGLWQVQEDAGKIAGRLPPALVDDVATSVAAAVERVAALASFEAYRTDAPTAAARRTKCL